MSNSPILIVGAGCSGLVLALTLVQNGISVRIIDKETTPRIGERGSSITPRTLEVHDFLGTLPDLTVNAIPRPLMLFYGEDGTTLVKSIDTSPHIDPTSDKPHPNPVLLGQDKQEAVLRSHLTKYNCLVEYGTELRSFQRADDGVIAHLVKQSNGQETEEVAKFQYLAGTDGAHSVVRKNLDVSFLGETREKQNLVVGDIWVKEGLDGKCWHSWGEPGTKMISLRATGQTSAEKGYKFSFLSLGLALDHAKMASGRDSFLESFIDITKRTDVQFGDLVWISNYRPNIRMVDAFAKDRVFLAGDAAHCHTPAGGQGMNSSIQDAFNLGWKLALVLKGLSLPSLLESYNQERLPVIAVMLNLTTGILDKAFTSFTLSGKDDSAFLRSGDLHQLGVNYRHSPIILDSQNTQSDGKPAVAEVYHAGSGVRAGDRAPDASGFTHLKDADTNAAQRLFKILGTDHHTLLVYSDGTIDHSDILAAVRSHKDVFKTVLVLPSSITQTSETGFDFVLQDGESHLHKNYGVDANHSTVVIIRPDAYIGAIGHGVGDVQSYLDKVLVQTV
ncbi:hypothetical protein BDN72DRAFT_814023 [Pluteus cervinus]|uniref:Uncharacterized protein n=1 Tax=Pluteus cervinus TaxID=181527 RepID=A0ACD3B9R2_9AGAR|nr:hypothetical protein BDN72DRAFT_814023 [Pluteus cervinus]